MITLGDSNSSKLDKRVYKTCMVIARLGLAYLFFTQLWWKLPPSFGCGADFAFPVPAEENHWNSNKSSGLCFWMGVESIFASKPNSLFALLVSRHLLG